MPALAAVLLAVAIVFQVRDARTETGAQAGAGERVYVISYQDGAYFHEVMRQRLQRIYDIAGIAVRFVGLPHRRSLRAANSGEVDGEVGRIPAIEQHYPNLVRVDEKVIDLMGHAYVMRGSDIRSYSPSLLDSLRVGIISGVKWGVYLTRFSKVVPVADLQSLFKLLEYDRADLILVTTSSAVQYLARLGTKAQLYRRLEPKAYSSPLYHYLNRKNADIIPALNRATKIFFEEMNKTE